MATYRGIKGFTMQSLASDPAANTNTEGQVWYNTTTNVLKGIAGAAGVGSWASGGNLNTARFNGGGIGIATAAAFAGGDLGPPGKTAVVEEYDGTSWTNVTSMPATQFFLASGGVQTAGWVAGGGGAPFPTATFTYDGTNWTSGGALNTGRYAVTGAGTQTTAFIAGGSIPPASPGGVGLTEKYNGTSWSESGDMNTVKYSGFASGTNTAGLMAGGHSAGSLTVNAETFNGTSWTEVANLNLARQRGAVGGGTSTNTSALVAGGYDGSVGNYRTANTESWNGTSWTEVADLSAVISGQGFATTGNTSALSFGGDYPPTTTHATTEVWSIASPTFSVKTFTAS